MEASQQNAATPIWATTCGPASGGQFLQLLEYVVALEVGHLIAPDMDRPGGHELPENSAGRLMGDLLPVTNGIPMNLADLEWGQGESIETTIFRNRRSDNL